MRQTIIYALLLASAIAGSAFLTKRQLAAKITAVAAERDMAKNAADELLAMVENLRTEIVATQAAMAGLSNRLAAATDKYEDELATNIPLRNMIENMLAQQAIDTAKLKREQTELTRIAKQYASAQKELESREDASKELRTRAEKAESALKKTEEETISLQTAVKSQKDEFGQRILTAEEQSRRDKSSLSVCRSALDEEKTLNADLREKLADARATIDELKTRQTDLERTTMEYERKIRSIEIRPADETQQPSSPKNDGWQAPK